MIGAFLIIKNTTTKIEKAVNIPPVILKTINVSSKLY